MATFAKFVTTGSKNLPKKTNETLNTTANGYESIYQVRLHQYQKSNSKRSNILRQGVQFNSVSNIA